MAEVGRGETVAEPDVSLPEMEVSDAGQAEVFADIVHLGRKPQMLAEEERVRLEILLAELLRLKGRLRAAQLRV